MTFEECFTCMYYNYVYVEVYTVFCGALCNVFIVHDTRSMWVFDSFDFFNCWGASGELRFPFLPSWLTDIAGGRDGVPEDQEL